MDTSLAQGEGGSEHPHAWSRARGHAAASLKFDMVMSGLSIEPQSTARSTGILSAFIPWFHAHRDCRLASDSCDPRQGHVRACLGLFLLLTVFLQTCLGLLGHH